MNVNRKEEKRRYKKIEITTKSIFIDSTKMEVIEKITDKLVKFKF